MNKKQIIIASIIGILLLFLFLLPEYKKDGQSKEIFSYTLNKIKKIEYKGKTIINGKSNQFIHYEINPVKTKYEKTSNLNKKRRYFLWQVKVLKFDYLGNNKQIQTLKNMKVFFGDQIMRSIFNDLRKLSYVYSIDDEVSKRKEYGYLGCINSFTIHTTTQKHSFCIGGKNHSKSKNYILYKNDNKVYLVHHYIINRLQKNIFDYREEKILPFSLKSIENIEFIIHKKYQKRFPILFSKTNGILKFYTEIYKSKRKYSQPKAIYHLANHKFIRTFLIETLMKRIEALELKGFNTKKVNLVYDSSIIVKIKLKNNRKFFHVNIWNLPIQKKWMTYYKTNKKPQIKDSYLKTTFQEGIYDYKKYENILQKLDDFEKQFKRKYKKK